MEGVAKTYVDAQGKAVTALTDIGFDVPAGSVTCIIGASGCGKSTLLRIIAGLETSYEGLVTVGDTAVTRAGLDRGMVFQDHRLVPWMTVAENVELSLHRTPAAQRRARVDATLELVSLLAFRDAYPTQLSGGMAQRVAIARALAHQPRVMLLDEPFGALDAITRMQLQDELLHIRAREQITTVMVTHDIEEALYLGDQVVVLSSRPGRIRAIVPIELPRPRDRAAADFAKLRIALYEQFFQHAH